MSKESTILKIIRKKYKKVITMFFPFAFAIQLIIDAFKKSYEILRFRAIKRNLLIKIF